MKKWSIDRNKILIAGHTHRAIFPKIGQGLYFNDGSCIYPNGITSLEIEKGKITLVKWGFKLNDEELVTVKRIVLEGNESIVNFLDRRAMIYFIAFFVVKKRKFESFVVYS